MLISLNWINDYVDIKDIPLNEKINRFLLSTAEIEDVYEKGKDISDVVFARIDKVEPHPNSQKLHVLEVFNGKEKLQVVCGAPNVRVGMVTALAQIGGEVCGHKITKARLAGVDSFGMCCSSAELGIGSDDDGIMDITDNVTIGQDIKAFYPIEDTIFEIDNKSLTNRPDLWGHYGIAREFAAIFNRPLKQVPVMDLTQYNNLPKLSIKVEDKNCFRYSGITIKNITKTVSPQQLIIRLNYVGQRDINLLADLTNYIMLDLGQPMHAFDNELVKGIVVKSAKRKQKMLTLEDAEHEVPENSVLICDQNETPVAIAGVKGGKLSGISEKTNSLLLESACFDATSIRKTSFAVGLRTDSSLRYEKSLDPNLTIPAIARFLHILKQVDNDVVVTSALTDVVTYSYPQIKIDIDYDFILNRTGIEKLTKEDIVKILTSLGFAVAQNGKHFVVSVPSHRATKDISIKEDLIEEIARLYGYDNIKPKSVLSTVEPIKQDKATMVEYKTKYLIASKYAYSEVHSHLWSFADFNKEFGIESPCVVSLLDSTNTGNSGIRSAMLPTLIKFFHENKNSFDEIKIFEIGRVAHSLDEQNMVNERKKLALLFASQTKSKEELYFELKAIVEDISKTLLSSQVTFQNKQSTLPNYFHPINSADVLAQNVTIGQIGLAHPELQHKLDKRFNIAIGEIYFDDLVNLAKEEITKYTPLIKFQDVDLDFNFKVSNSFTFYDVEKILSNFHSNLTFSYKLKDRYFQPDYKEFEYWTFSFNVAHKERTLTSEDIEKFSKRLTLHMAQNGITLKM